MLRLRLSQVARINDIDDNCGLVEGRTSVNNSMVKFKDCEWDTEFFGFKVAELQTANATATDLQSILKQLEDSGTKLVYWRVAIDDELSTKAAQQCGALFVGCQVTYIQLNGPQPKGLQPGVTRYRLPAPNEELDKLAQQSGVYSRYKNDKNISQAQFEGLYSTWIAKCVSGELADAVLVAERDNQMAGMVTVHNSDDISTIVLIAVEEKFRGGGVGDDLVRSALSLGSELGCSSHNVVTYRENAAACSLFEKWGYEAGFLQQFYHFWL